MPAAAAVPSPKKPDGEVERKLMHHILHCITPGDELRTAIKLQKLGAPALAAELIRRDLSDIGRPEDLALRIVYARIDEIDAPTVEALSTLATTGSKPVGGGGASVSGSVKYASSRVSPRQTGWTDAGQASTKHLNRVVPDDPIPFDGGLDVSPEKTVESMASELQQLGVEMLSAELRQRELSDRGSVEVLAARLAHARAQETPSTTPVQRSSQSHRSSRENSERANSDLEADFGTDRATPPISMGDASDDGAGDPDEPGAERQKEATSAERIQAVARGNVARRQSEGLLRPMLDKKQQQQPISVGFCAAEEKGDGSKVARAAAPRPAHPPCNHWFVSSCYKCQPQPRNALAEPAIPGVGATDAAVLGLEPKDETSFMQRRRARALARRRLMAGGPGKGVIHMSETQRDERRKELAKRRVRFEMIKKATYDRKDEADEKVVKNTRHLKLKRVWGGLRLFMLTFTVFWWPLRFAFYSQSNATDAAWRIGDLLPDAYFLADIAFFFAVHASELEEHIYDYMRLHSLFDDKRGPCLWLELTALIPINIARSSRAAPDMLKLVSVTRLLRVQSLLGWFSAKEKDVHVSVQQIAIFKFILAIFGVSHWVGCLWWWVASWSDFDESTWIYQYLEVRARTTIEQSKEHRADAAFGCSSIRGPTQRADCSMRMRMIHSHTRVTK